MDKNGNLIVILNQGCRHNMDDMYLLYREYFKQYGRRANVFVMHPETFYLFKKECERTLATHEYDRRFMGVEILRSEDIDLNEVRVY